MTSPAAPRADTSHGPSGSGSGRPNVGIAPGSIRALNRSPSTSQATTCSMLASGQRSTRSSTGRGPEAPGPEPGPEAPAGPR